MEEILLKKCDEVKKMLDDNLELYMRLIPYAKKKYDKKYLNDIRDIIVSFYRAIDDIKKRVGEKDYLGGDPTIDINHIVTIIKEAEEQREKLKNFSKTEFASEKQIAYIVTLLAKNDDYMLRDDICLDVLTKKQAITIIKALKGEIGYDKSARKLLEKNFTPTVLTDNEKEAVYENIINYLNEKVNKRYKSHTTGTRKLIDERLSEGFTEDDFYKVIDNKANDWKGTDFAKYLRPKTLFGEKFETYLKGNNIRLVK